VFVCDTRRMGMVSTGGRVYCVGGFDGNAPLDCVISLDPRTRFWVPTHTTRTTTTTTSSSFSSSSSIDMYNNDVGKESAQKFMKQTGALKAATLYFVS
jgi:hypothetical protein